MCPLIAKVRGRFFQTAFNYPRWLQDYLKHIFLIKILFLLAILSFRFAFEQEHSRSRVWVYNHVNMKTSSPTPAIFIFFEIWLASLIASLLWVAMILILVSFLSCCNCCYFIIDHTLALFSSVWTCTQTGETVHAIHAGPTVLTRIGQAFIWFCKTTDL